MDLPLSPALRLQVYHLASVRLRDLCVRMDVSSELRGKIWTCFENSLVHSTGLMRDRHLDQLLLCSVYIVSKVSSHLCVPGDALQSVHIRLPPTPNPHRPSCVEQEPRK